MAVAQFSGLASGIDSGALIDAVIQARELTNELRRQDIEFLESENEALNELNTKLLALDSLIGKFRSSNGGGITRKGSSTDSSVLTASAGTNAINASYSLTVSGLANAATGSFDESFASSTDAVWDTGGSATGQISMTVGQGADQIALGVTVTEGVTSLSDIANLFNADQNNNGRVAASVVNVGTEQFPSYRLVFNTLETGLSKGELMLSSSVPTMQDITINQATNAFFAIDGISGVITRESNTVSDVVSGVTFQLTGLGSADVTIDTDADSSAEDLSEIVTAYNDIVQFVNENDFVERVEDDGEAANIYGKLGKARVDNDFLTSFRLSLAAATGAGDEVTSMAELGISTNRDGTLSFDADRFKDQVNKDPDGASSVLQSFADSVSGISGVIHQYTKLNGFIDIAQSGNNAEIENLNTTIQQIERRTAKERSSLERQFARLESVTSRLQSSAQALTGILAGLG